MYLEELVDYPQAENGMPECTIRLNRENVIDWLKDIAGFANTSGGEFYIGAENRTNKLNGFDRNAVQMERTYFRGVVNEHLFPIPQIRTSLIRYITEEDERFIIQVIVEESMEKPVVVNYNSVPAIFMRREGFTNAATYEEITEMCLNRVVDTSIVDKTLPVLSFVPVPNGTDLDEKVLSFCYLKAHKVSEIAEHLGIKDSSYLRKKVLENLETNGYLEKSKVSRVSRAMFYKTKPEMVSVE